MPVRDRAGWYVRAATPNRSPIVRDRIRRLCNRRTCGRQHKEERERARGNRASFAGGSTALSDGCWDAGRLGRIRTPRRRRFDCVMPTARPQWTPVCSTGVVKIRNALRRPYGSLDPACAVRAQTTRVRHATPDRCSEILAARSARSQPSYYLEPCGRCEPSRPVVRILRRWFYASQGSTPATADS
jgi:hypothetical protein